MSEEVYNKLQSLIWAIDFEITRDDLSFDSKNTLKKIRNYLKRYN